MTTARPPLWRIVIANTTEILILTACVIANAVAWQYIGFGAFALALLASIFVASIAAFRLSRWAAS